MTNDESAMLAVFRAEINGKIDLLLERSIDMKESIKDHEARLRDVEEHGSPTAALTAVQVGRVASTLDGVNKRLWMVFGGVSVTVFIVNLGVAKGWF